MSVDSQTALERIRGDLRYAARTLLKAPGFLLAVLSLGLAVGATSAVYGTVDWLLDRSPAGVVAPDRLVGLTLSEPGAGEYEGHFGFSYPQYLALRDVQDAFVDVAAYGKLPLVAGADSWQEQVVFQFVSGTYFPLLGVRPALGRLIGPEDDEAGAVPAVVLSHALWRSRFGSDPRVVGSHIRLQTGEGRIVGVLPASYEDYALDWNAPTALWLPMSGARAVGMEVMLTSPTTFFPILGRMRPAVTTEIARERAQRWMGSLPPLGTSASRLDAIAVRPERELRIARRPAARAFLGSLLIVCVLVVGAAGVNVVSFFLGRAAQRRYEIAVRSAMGADRRRILRQLLTEASLLAGATAVTAVLLGAGVARLLAELPSVYLDLPLRDAPLTTARALDLRMIGIAAALGAAASFALAVLPMLAAFGDPISALRGTTGGRGWGRFRPTRRQTALAMQVALAVVLSITAALYAQTFHNAVRADPEYADPATLLIARIIPSGIPRADYAPFYDELLDRLRAEPWVASAALSANPPYAGGVGRVNRAGDPDRVIDIDGATVTPGLFATLGVPLVSGRALDAGDMGEPVAIVNRTLAERLWPGEDPVGRTYEHNATPVRVVGVVARERCRDLLAPPKECAWRPLGPGGGIRTVNVRTIGPAAEGIARVRDIVAELRPDMVVAGAWTLEDFLETRVRAERAAAVGSASLALFGVLLLVVGCASLFLALVRDSLRDIAIRMALGATRGRVVATIAGHGLILAAAGVLVGIPVAVAVTSRIDGQLYGVSATDLPTFVAVPALILLVALASVAWAAWLGAKAPPNEFLRTD